MISFNPGFAIKMGRRCLRKALHYIIYYTLRLGGSHILLANALLLKEKFRQSDVLRVVAPGASVIVGDAALSSRTVMGDVLCVNYAIECDKLNLWRNASFFLIENHALYRRYIDAVRSAVAEKGALVVIVKGFGSPKKVVSAIRFLSALSAIKNVTVLMFDDVYATDLPCANDFGDLVSGACPDVVSGAKTLQWVLSFGYACGYGKIILHGFDFGVDYAYANASTDYREELPPNTWVNKAGVRDAAITDVVSFSELMRSQGREIMQASCQGPLANILPQEDGYV